MHELVANDLYSELKFYRQIKRMKPPSAQHHQLKKGTI